MVISTVKCVLQGQHTETQSAGPFPGSRNLLRALQRSFWLPRVRPGYCIQVSKHISTCEEADWDVGRERAVLVVCYCVTMLSQVVTTQICYHSFYKSGDGHGFPVSIVEVSFIRQQSRNWSGLISHLKAQLGY